MNRAHRHKKQAICTRRKAALMRLAAWVKKEERRVINFLRGERFGKKVTDESKQRTALLNSMSNWQRNKFLIACKGNPDRVSIGTMQGYADMPHWKKGKANG